MTSHRRISRPRILKNQRVYKVFNRNGLSADGMEVIAKNKASALRKARRYYDREDADSVEFSRITTITSIKN